MNLSNQECMINDKSQVRPLHKAHQDVVNMFLALNTSRRNKVMKFLRRNYTEQIHAVIDDYYCEHENEFYTFELNESCIFDLPLHHKLISAPSYRVDVKKDFLFGRVIANHYHDDKYTVLYDSRKPEDVKMLFEKAFDAYKYQNGH